MTEAQYVVNEGPSGRVVHLPSCPSIRHQVEHDRVYFDSEAAYQAASEHEREHYAERYSAVYMLESDLHTLPSYRPCGMCNPPVLTKRSARAQGVHELSAQLVATKHLGREFVWPPIGALARITIDRNGVTLAGTNGSVLLDPSERVSYRAEDGSSSNPPK